MPLARPYSSIAVTCRHAATERGKHSRLIRARSCCSCLPKGVVPRNRLLAALQPEVLAALLPKCNPLILKSRQQLYRADAAIDAVYFVEAGMISLVANMDDGMQAEIGIVGREGMLGVSLLSGIDKSFVDSMVQMPGAALRMAVRDFRHEMDVNAAFRGLLARYNEALHTQIMQTAVCNGHHGLEQRLARWLLMAHDRVDGEELPLTQDFMASMLGVYRPSITVTAGILQRAGLIRYTGGRVTVIDRLSLEAAACECYGVVHRRLQTLMGPASP
jgi:CRP-like cAMP-binding protein